MKRKEQEEQEEDLSLYEWQVRYNERCYQFYLFSLDMATKVLKAAIEQYQNTDNPILKNELIQTIADATKNLKDIESQGSEATRTYQRNREYLESLR